MTLYVKDTILPYINLPPDWLTDAITKAKAQIATWPPWKRQYAQVALNCNGIVPARQPVDNSLQDFVECFHKAMTYRPVPSIMESITTITDTGVPYR